MVIFDDSQLVINFCNRVAKPGRPKLLLALQQVRELTKKLPLRPSFRHVPREFNKIADWLTNVAR